MAIELVRFFFVFFFILFINIELLLMTSFWTLLETSRKTFTGDP